MFRRIIIPLLAVVGLGWAIFMMYYGTRKPPVAHILFEPPVSPYKHYIAGEGIVEAFHRQVELGVPFPELVSDVYVNSGDMVTKGTKLFKLDTRRLEALREQAIKELCVAQKEYENATQQFSFYERVQDKAAISEQAYAAALYAQQIAAEKVAAARAAVHTIEVDIERSLICAPTDGQVLQSNVLVGSVANVNPFSNEPLMLFGDASMYQLRIDIDEEDAWRMQQGAPAVAFVRGNARIKIPLKYLYYEPYVVAKKSLTGSASERVDTRVLQVLYEFSRADYPVYPGQLLDVYLEALPSGGYQ